MLLNLCLCNTFDNSLSRSMPITVRGMLCGRISSSASIPHKSFKLRKASQRPQDRWGSFGSPCLSRLGWPIWHSKENKYRATMCMPKQKRIRYTRRASTTRLKGKRNKIVTFEETISVQQISSTIFKNDLQIKNQHHWRTKILRSKRARVCSQLS